MNINYEMMFGIDKQMHVFGYGAIAIVAAMVILTISDMAAVKRRMIYCWFALVTVGMLEEYRQYFVAERDAELLDAVANTVGITFGMLSTVGLFYLFYYWHHTLVRVIAVSSIVVLALFIGLVFLNERPFVTFDQPVQEKVDSFVARIWP
ncbi:VanZ family protein [Thalassobacillus hwangdonensis]|uniref:VanZ family protein n=1 Tax=Thalassobacillus hwangdonensis TaxID=546108 RepID=A0ABW3L5D6_9BACI